MIVVGIVGKKGSGKSTFAFFLQEHLRKCGYTTVRASFGNALKAMLVETQLCKPQHVYGRKTKSSRFLLQCIGTDIVRKVDPHYWCQQVWDHLRWTFAIEPSAVVIIDDVRFVNEWRMLLSLNAVMVKIERPSKDDAQDNHRSETEMDSIDFFDLTCLNAGTKKTLQENAFWAANTISLSEKRHTATKKSFRKENMKKWKL